jgi:hypothetical protein
MATKVFVMLIILNKQSEVLMLTAPSKIKLQGHLKKPHHGE